MSRPRLTGLALAAAVALTATLVLAPAGAAASRPKVSFTQIENEVMCVACHESLAVANAPEAYSERQYIRDLIHEGYNEHQILNRLVAAYGPAVLGRPPASGFGVLVYVLPPAIVALGLAILFFTLPRWRRRTRSAQTNPVAHGPPLDPEAARRLEQDLARFEG